MDPFVLVEEIMVDCACVTYEDGGVYLCAGCADVLRLDLLPRSVDRPLGQSAKEWAAERGWVLTPPTSGPTEQEIPF